MKKLFLALLFVPMLVLAQQDSVLSGVYKYKAPVGKMENISSLVLLEGKTHDFEWMQITSNLILSVNPIRQQVPKNEEHLLILKSGLFTIKLGDSVFEMRPGSIVVLMPGQKYAISCRDPGSYFTMKYRGKSPVDKEQMQKNGGSFVKVYDSVVYKPNNRGGGRKDFFERPTVMQKRFEMHITVLKEGLTSHDPHTHRAEEIVLIINGQTEMLIGDKTFQGKEGDFYYLGTNVLHGIKNTGVAPCMYFAIQFE
jgi:(S)-ureidoglycine aminohydrolase